MWRGKTVAVILPTYNERDSIRAAAFDFRCDGLADEVIVVNNNAAPGTSEEVAGSGARELFEPRQGYGNALLCGIDNCYADLIVFAEPDGTFSGHDLLKLLAYSDDVPVVFGTRTSREFIWAGANMGPFSALGKLGGGQDDGVAVQHHHPHGHGLHVSSFSPRSVAANPSAPHHRRLALRAATADGSNRTRDSVHRNSGELSSPRGRIQRDRRLVEGVLAGDADDLPGAELPLRFAERGAGSLERSATSGNPAVLPETDRARLNRFARADTNGGENEHDAVRSRPRGRGTYVPAIPEVESAPGRDTQAA